MNYLKRFPINSLRRVLPVVFFSVLISCVKDKPNSITPTPVKVSSTKKVYIINEGNFGIGNGSISLFNPTDLSLVSDYYKTQNTVSAGDVVQSLNYINDKFYVVVNNSKKIIQCDASFKSTGQVSGLTSPRYIQAVSNQKAYVSDLYANSIHVIDLNSLTVMKEIPCAGSTEKMRGIYNKVFVTNSEKNYVYVINTLTDEIQDSVFVGSGASSLEIDQNDQLWVLASGKLSSQKGRLSCINATNNQVTKYFEFDISKSPWQLCISGKKDSLYFINEHIYTMSIHDTQLPSNAFINRGTKNFYGLGYNPNDYKLYASDAIDYSQSSTIYMYDTNGNQIYVFKAGINSNGFYFE